MNPSQVVWGVDTRTHRIAFGASDGRTCSVDIPKRLRGAERLAKIRTATWHLAREFADGSPPLCVFVEEPRGKHRKTEHAMVQVVGVVQEAIYASLETLYAYPVSIYEVQVAQWKKAALGIGSASKEDVMAWADEVATECGLIEGPANQDCADALAIAVAGRSMVASEEGKAA